MIRRPLVWTCALLSLGMFAGQSIPQEKPVDRGSNVSHLDEIVRSILNAKSPDEAARWYKTLFNQVGPNELQNLRFHQNHQIAVQAAWQEVESTVPVNPPDVVRPDRDKLAWFLGFLEGRARIQLPAWWSEALIDSRANRRGNIYAGGLHLRDQTKVKLDAARHPRAAILERQGGNFAIRVGEESVVLSDDSISRLGISLVSNKLSVLFTPSRYYIAVHDDTGYAYKVISVDRSSMAILWIGKAWGSCWADTTGLHHQWIEVTEQGDRVVIFGIASTGVHIETFRREDGVNDFRFSDSYSPW